MSEAEMLQPESTLERRKRILEHELEYGPDLELLGVTTNAVSRRWCSLEFGLSFPSMSVFALPC